MNKRVLIITPHADDVTIFIGGIVKQLSNSGKDVYVARVTNDDYDAYDLDRETAIIRNREEAEEAYGVLGVKDVIHMGYESDNMSTVDYKLLRGKIVKLIRDIRPYEMYNFDIDGREEDNLDLKVIAAATAEALWISSFHLHYPDHLTNGIKPYSVPVRKKYFRVPDSSYQVKDISDVIEVKIEALKKHKTVMKNMLMQAIMRGESFCCEHNKNSYDLDLNTLIDSLGRRQAMLLGEGHNIEYAECVKDEGLGLSENFIEV
jgi:LmbE family N-acetylglucosaminyl deacetylase